MHTIESDMGTLLLITTLPDEAQAVKLAEALVTGRLAACVHLLPRGISVYRWRGEIHKAAEVTLLIKTTVSRYAELEALIRRLHPYDVPEVIGFPVERGLPAYLQWIVDETSEIA